MPPAQNASVTSPSPAVVLSNERGKRGGAMGCQDGAGAGTSTGEDRSEVTELREQILRLEGHYCHEEEEKSRTELQEKLNICKRDTLIELCRSLDIVGSRANRKEELVSFLMKFPNNKRSRIAAPNPIKVTDLREQILQLIGHACDEEEEKSRTDLLETLNTCKRDTLIELCRSFDITGSRANRKEELVSFLMKFITDHSSSIDGTNPDKKIKKRKRVKDEENMCSGKPLKKKKREGTALETEGIEEENGMKGVEDRMYSEHGMKDNGYVRADNMKVKFPYGFVNFEPSERINGFLSENVDAVTLNEAPIRIDEQALTTSPSAKVVATPEVDSANVKALKKKKSSVIKKKATPKKDRKMKSCGKGASGEHIKPRKQAIKPSRDELREAIVLILDAMDFATMTFGDVVKEVDKYFGKDLFERKPLIRSLIEEELFRLSEEAEKMELEDEEAAEAKARGEQAAKEMAQVQTVVSSIDKWNKLQAGKDGKTEDCAKNTNGNANEEDVKGGPSVESSDNRNSNNAAKGSQNGRADAGTKLGDNESTMDGKSEKVSPNVNSDIDVQGFRKGKDAILKNHNVDALGGSKDGKMKEVHSRENDDTEDGRAEEGRSENVGNNAEDVNCCEADESKSRANDERVERAGEGKAQEASSGNSSDVAIYGDEDDKAKEGIIDAEQSPTDTGSNGKAEDASHNAITKVDVDSGKNGAAENGKTGNDVKADSDGIAKRS